MRNFGAMSAPSNFDVQILAPTLAELRGVLELGADVELDAEVPLGDVAVLREGRVSKSSGFEGTQYVLEGLVAVTAGTTSDLLAAWLRERLKRNPRATAVVDGESLQAGDAETT